MEGQSEEDSTVNLESRQKYLKEKKDKEEDHNMMLSFMESKMRTDVSDDVTINNRVKGKKGLIMVQQYKRHQAEIFEEAMLQTITKTRLRELTKMSDQKKQKNGGGRGQGVKSKTTKILLEDSPQLENQKISIRMLKDLKNDKKIATNQNKAKDGNSVYDNKEIQRFKSFSQQKIDFFKDLTEGDVIWSGYSSEEGEGGKEEENQMKEININLFQKIMQQENQLQIITDGNFNLGGVSLQIDFDEKIIIAVKSVKSEEIFQKEVKALMALKRRPVAPEEQVALKLLSFDKNNLVFSQQAGFISYRQVFKIVQLKQLQERYRQPFEFFIMKQLLCLVRKLNQMNCSYRIAHSDIKPNNIVIGFDYVPYFIDFGGAIFIDEDPDDYLSFCTLAFVMPKYTELEHFDEQTILNCERSSLMLTFLFMLCRTQEENKLFFQKKYSELISRMKLFYSQSLMDMMEKAILQDELSQVEARVKGILDSNLGEYIKESENILKFLKELKQFEFSPRENLYVIKEWDDFNQNMLKLFPSVRFEIDLLQVNESRKLYEYFKSGQGGEVFVDTSRGFFITLINSFLDFSEECHTVIFLHLDSEKNLSDERFKINDLITQKDGFLTIKLNFGRFQERGENEEQLNEGQFKLEDDQSQQKQSQKIQINFQKMRTRMSAFKLKSEESVLWSIFSGLILANQIQELKVKCLDLDIKDFQLFLNKQRSLRSFHVRIKEQSYKIQFPKLSTTNQLFKLKTNLIISNLPNILFLHQESLIDLEITINAAQTCSHTVTLLSSLKFLNKLSLRLTQIHTRPEENIPHAKCQLDNQSSNLSSYKKHRVQNYKKRGPSGHNLSPEFYHLLMVIFSKTRVPTIKLNFEDSYLNSQDIYKLSQCFMSSATTRNSQSFFEEAIQPETKPIHLNTRSQKKFQTQTVVARKILHNTSELLAHSQRSLNNTKEIEEQEEDEIRSYYFEDFENYEEPHGAQTERLGYTKESSSKNNSFSIEDKCLQRQVSSKQAHHFLGPHTVKINLKMKAKFLDEASTKQIINSLLQSHIPRIKVQIKNSHEQEEFVKQSTLNKSQKRSHHKFLSLFDTFEKNNWVKQISIGLHHYNLNTQEIINSLGECNKFKLLLKGYNNNLLSHLENLKFTSEEQTLVIKPSSDQLNCSFSKINFTNEQVISDQKSAKKNKQNGRSARTLSLVKMKQGQKLEDYIDFKSNKLFTLGTAYSCQNYMSNNGDTNNFSNSTTTYNWKNIHSDVDEIKQDITSQENEETDILGGFAECIKNNESLQALTIDLTPLHHLVKPQLVKTIFDCVKYNKSLEQLTINASGCLVPNSGKSFISCLSFNENLKIINLTFNNCQLNGLSFGEVAKALIQNESLEQFTASILNNSELTSAEEALLILKDAPSKLDYTFFLSDLEDYSQLFSNSFSQYVFPNSPKCFSIVCSNKQYIENSYSQFHIEESAQQVRDFHSTSSSQSPQIRLPHRHHNTFSHSNRNPVHNHNRLLQGHQTIFSRTSQMNNSDIFRQSIMHFSQKLPSLKIQESEKKLKRNTVQDFFKAHITYEHSPQSYSDEEDDEASESIPLRVQISNSKRKALWVSKKMSHIPSTQQPSLSYSKPQSQIETQVSNKQGLLLVIEKRKNQLNLVLEDCPQISSVSELLKNNQTLLELSIQLSPSSHLTKTLSNLSEGLSCNQLLKSFSMKLDFLLNKEEISELKNIISHLPSRLQKLNLSLQNARINMIELKFIMQLLQHENDNLSEISLDLQSNNIQPHSVKQLGLFTSVNLQSLSLNLSNNFLNNDGLSALCEQFIQQSPPNLKNLSLLLDNNQLNNTALSLLSSFVNTNITLNSLNLSLHRNSIRYEFLSFLQNFLQNHATIKQYSVEFDKNVDCQEEEKMECI